MCARITDRSAGLRKYLAERECRICGQPASNMHHLYPRSQGGDDVADNLIPLCGSGTTGCHGLIEAHDRNHRHLLGLRLTTEERSYLVSKLGSKQAAEAWLQRHYG